MIKFKLKPVQYINLLVLMLVSSCGASKRPVNKQDPLEPLNRGLYKVHKTIDALYLNPIVQIYTKFLPMHFKKIFSNFFNNINEVPLTINSLLQGKIAQARDSTARFTLNTTLGIGGLFDVASYADLKLKKGDFGQTLYNYGYKKSLYLFIPIIGPTTFRDLLGLGGNMFLSIPYHAFKPKWRNRYNLAYIVHYKGSLSEAQSLVNIASIDQYAFIRNAYLENRSYFIGEEPKIQD